MEARKWMLDQRTSTKNAKLRLIKRRRRKRVERNQNQHSKPQSRGSLELNLRTSSICLHEKAQEYVRKAISEETQPRKEKSSRVKLNQ
jgi:hypothetical protein